MAGGGIQGIVELAWEALKTLLSLDLWCQSLESSLIQYLPTFSRCIEWRPICVSRRGDVAHMRTRGNRAYRATQMGITSPRARKGKWMNGDWAWSTNWCLRVWKILKGLTEIPSDQIFNSLKIVFYKKKSHL